MARIGLPHADDRHAVAAALRRQIEVDDLRKLLLQDRHEDLVERHPQHRRLVGRLAGVGRVVDRVLAHRQARDLEHREPVLLVVVAGVVAVRPLQRVQVAVLLLQPHAVLADALEAGLGRRDVALQHDLGAGRHLQHQAALAHLAVGQLGAAATQQAGELVFRETVRYRGHRAEDRGRIRPQSHHDRKGLSTICMNEFTEIQRSTAVSKPAHDDLTPPDHLLAVDAQVLASARPGHRLRTAGHHQPPGDQRRHVARPAVLHRQPAQVDVRPLDHPLLAGRPAHHRWLHVPQGSCHLPQLAGILEPLRGLGLLQTRQQLADVAQRSNAVGPHAEGDTLRRAEQIGNCRCREFLCTTHRIGEQQRRTASAQGAIREPGHFQIGRDGFFHFQQLPSGFQGGEEVSQVTVFHDLRL